MHQHLSYRGPRARRRKKSIEKIFEEIMVENSRINISRHTLIKLTEIKHKERILKSSREKQEVTYKGKPI